MRRSVCLALVLFGCATVRGAWAADSFDLIYCNRMTCTLLSDAGGFTLGYWGFGIIVNTGPTPLETHELAYADFTSSSSVSGFRLTPFVGNLPGYAPIPLGRAVGSVLPPNALLEGLLGAGEEFENTQPDAVLTWAFSRTSPRVTYSGPINFDVMMTVGGQRVHFPVEIDLQYGDTDVVSVVSVDRVSSSGTTPAIPTTWGRLKSLYR